MAPKQPYKAEYAKSGRAKCKTCKMPIEHGDLRLAVMTQVCSFFFLFICKCPCEENQQRSSCSICLTIKINIFHIGKLCEIEIINLMFDLANVIIPLLSLIFFYYFRNKHLINSLIACFVSPNFMMACKKTGIISHAFLEEQGREV